MERGAHMKKKNDIEFTTWKVTSPKHVSCSTVFKVPEWEGVTWWVATGHKSTWLRDVTPNSVNLVAGEPTTFEEQRVVFLKSGTARRAKNKNARFTCGPEWPGKHTVMLLFLWSRMFHPTLVGWLHPLQSRSPLLPRGKWTQQTWRPASTEPEPMAIAIMVS